MCIRDSFIRVGDGVYRIRNRASGKLLDLTMTGTANGTWLHLWEDCLLYTSRCV